MSGIQIKAVNLGKVKSQVSKYANTKAKSAVQVVNLAAVQIQNDIKSSIQEHRSAGRKYKKSGSSVVHVASSPGNPPNTDTGSLVRSIVINSGQTSQTVYTAEVLVDPRARSKDKKKQAVVVKYALWLEKGTSRMRKRPFIKPAKDKWIPKVRKMLARDFKSGN